MNKYQQQAKYLTENPHYIYTHWNNSLGLFQALNRPGGPEPRRYCGCPTQVKALWATAITKDLTDRVHTDSRIPRYPNQPTPEHFTAFEELQRELDERYGEDKVDTLALANALHTPGTVDTP